MVWIGLGAAIISEVTATLALRASDGLTRLWPSVLVVAGYGLAFVLLGQSLKTIGVGTAYAMWSGLGTVGATAGGWVLFAEQLNVTAIVGIVLVVAGVVVMNLAGSVTHG